MREQRPAARGFPAQTRAEPAGFDGNEHQPGLTGAVPPRALAHLFPGREMDEPVAPIVLRAVIASGGDRRRPYLRRAHVIDDLAHATRLPAPAIPAKPDC